MITANQMKGKSKALLKGVLCLCRGTALECNAAVRWYRRKEGGKEGRKEGGKEWLGYIRRCRGKGSQELLSSFELSCVCVGALAVEAYHRRRD